ncbi:hypothetical protein [Rivularia sp. UHCC 0363]|uniref:hypothetical protein n=1 Tax=Rivularia sp. UHCC 0363 TaxID=3110244 RepID=UPI002B21BD47|nr:hypothetical protein [Rivularia sp. UHCC 0363]MEA5595266.1 hypothetical protein [Rivularia sp. UHCC 0363]
MSVLTEALEKVEYWLWQNYPELANSLPSGLTAEEINDVAKSLPFSLSKEIQELYEWGNGSPGIFGTLNYSDEGLGFMSLEKAIANTLDCEHITEWLNLPCFYMFPEFERWIHFAVCDEEETSPILVVTDDPCTRFAYASITSMVLTTVECYEKEIIVLGKYGGIKFNDSLTSNILYRYSDILYQVDEYLDAEEEFKNIVNKNNSIFNQQAIIEKYNIEI